MTPSPPIRVVRLITRLNIGGPSIQAVELSSRLAARGFETLLVHGQLGPGEGDMRYLLEANASPPRTTQLKTLRRDIDPVHDARAIWQMYRLLCDIRPAIVHTHMAKAGGVGRLAAAAYNRTAGRRAPARLVHTYHGHVLEGYFSPAQTRLFLAAERCLASVTDRIVAISPRIREELVSDYRIGRADQYRVVPLGFDLQPLAAIDGAARARARRALRIAADQVVVTTAGRLTAIKDQALFLDVAARVVRVHPNTLFLIAGDGELRGELEARAAALGVADRVRLLGWQRDLDMLYGASDIFLLTSRNEGTPVALIESLAAGCAGVSTDVGGVRDVMPSSDVGLTAPAGDADQLAALVGALVRDPQRRRTLGAAGRAHVVARYGIDRLVDDVEALYRDLLA